MSIKSISIIAVKYAHQLPKEKQVSMTGAIIRDTILKKLI